MNDHNIPMPKRSFSEKLLNFFRLTAQPTIKVYHGYGHDHNLTIFGHLFSLSPFPRKTYRQSFLRNTFSLLRLFIVKPLPATTIELEWKGKKISTTSSEEGFFKFDWKDEAPFEFGWFPVKVTARRQGATIATSIGRILIPHPTQYIVISDIDDTFLVSHSAHMAKRLKVLFTQNARSRKPFDSVVKHYQLLSYAATDKSTPNPFFFVSSSEWNLYEYILEFTAVNKMPRGIFLLSQLKGLSELLKTGQNNHMTKFTRIARIMEAYPHQRVILLGDSSQQDPVIYQSIVEHFPKQVHAVYIRDVFEKKFEEVQQVVATMQQAGVPCLFFKKSEEAILHSVKIGLVDASAAEVKLEQIEDEAEKEATEIKPTVPAD